MNTPWTPATRMTKRSVNGGFEHHQDEQGDLNQVARADERAGALLVGELSVKRHSGFLGD